MLVGRDLVQATRGAKPVFTERGRLGKALHDATRPSDVGFQYPLGVRMGFRAAVAREVRPRRLDTRPYSRSSFRAYPSPKNFPEGRSLLQTAFQRLSFPETASHWFPQKKECS